MSSIYAGKHVRTKARRGNRSTQQKDLIQSPQGKQGRQSQAQSHYMIMHRQHTHMHSQHFPPRHMVTFQHLTETIPPLCLLHDIIPLRRIVCMYVHLCICLLVSLSTHQTRLSSQSSVLSNSMTGEGSVVL